MGAQQIDLAVAESPAAPCAQSAVGEDELAFLRRSALHTWRYFAEFSTAEHNWLIPDNVQEEPPVDCGARFADQYRIAA